MMVDHIALMNPGIISKGVGVNVADRAHIASDLVIGKTVSNKSKAGRVSVKFYCWCTG